VIPKLFQFTEHPNVVHLYAETHDKFVFMAFEIKAVLLPKARRYIMACLLQQVILLMIET
jgi:hypothetical protein